jgi:tetratricopeptide (TPR) repeat protein
LADDSSGIRFSSGFSEGLALAEDNNENIKGFVFNPFQGDQYLEKIKADWVNDPGVRVQTENDIMPSYEAAKLLLENEKYQEAIESFSLILSKCPSHAKSYRDRAIALYKTGQVSRALSDLSLAIAYDHKNAINYYIRSSIKYAQSNTDGALADCNSAVELDK